MNWHTTLSRCSYCGVTLTPSTAIEDKDRVCCINCKSDKGSMNLSDYRKHMIKKRKTKSFVFWFEILIFSDFGQRLRTMYALEQKTRIL